MEPGLEPPKLHCSWSLVLRNNMICKITYPSYTKPRIPKIGVMGDSNARALCVTAVTFSFSSSHYHQPFSPLVN